MAEKSVLDWIALILVIIGGLNWGLVAISADYDVVALLLGTATMASRIVYGLVGLAALYTIYDLFKE